MTQALCIGFVYDPVGTVNLALAWLNALRLESSVAPWADEARKPAGRELLLA